MPPTQTTEDLEAAIELRRMRAGIGVLVLSHYVETAYAMQLLGVDASGVLDGQGRQLDKFVEAVRRVGTGGSVRPRRRRHRQRRH